MITTTTTTLRDPTVTIEAGEVLSATMHTMVSQAAPIAMACAVAILPFTVADFLFASSGAVSPAVLNIFSTIVTCWLHAVIAHLTLGALEGRPVTFATAAGRAMPATGSLFALTILQGVLVLLGLVLLVVPAVLFWVWTYVALPVAVFEKVTGVAALQRSTELTEGHRGAVLAVGVVTLVVLVAGLGVVFSPLLVALADADESAFDRALSSETIGYGLVVGVALLQALWSTLNTVAVTVLYVRLRDARAGVDGEALARVFE